MTNSTKEQLLNAFDLDKYDLKAVEKLTLQILLHLEAYEERTGERMTASRYMEILKSGKSEL